LVLKKFALTDSGRAPITIAPRSLFSAKGAIKREPGATPQEPEIINNQSAESAIQRVALSALTVFNT
jgi:hypothetical protein